jgi:hypothetical protein
MVESSLTTLQAVLVGFSVPIALIALSANWFLLKLFRLVRQMTSTECMVMDEVPKANPHYILNAWGFPLNWLENSTIVGVRSIIATNGSIRSLA